MWAYFNSWYFFVLLFHWTVKLGRYCKKDCMNIHWNFYVISPWLHSCSLCIDTSPMVMWSSVTGMHVHAIEFQNCRCVCMCAGSVYAVIQSRTRKNKLQFIWPITTNYRENYLQSIQGVIAAPYKQISHDGERPIYHLSCALQNIVQVQRLGSTGKFSLPMLHPLCAKYIFSRSGFL